MATDDGLIIFTSINEEDDAETMIMEMLDLGLITSGTIFPGVKLYYKWEKTINKDEEYKIMLKTTHARYAAIEKYIQENHHYMAPEIVKIDASFGSEEFRAFVRKKFEQAQP